MPLFKKNMKSELVETDRNSYLLLDNNVIQALADAYENPKQAKPWAMDLYKWIIDNKIQLLLADLVMFEFLRGSTSSAEYEVKNKLLDALFDYSTEVKDYDVLEIARIANIYEMKNIHKKPSFIDLFLAHILRAFAENDLNIRLATFNHRDFSTLFLDRSIKAVDLGDEIMNLCFYKFNKGKFNILEAKFNDGKYVKNRSKKQK